MALVTAFLRHGLQIAIILMVILVFINYENIRRTDHDSRQLPAKGRGQRHTRTSQKSGTKRKNVLFIMSDDLRPQLNCYRGQNFPNPNSAFQMYTPNIDKLASESLLFRRAYVQMSICGPSRASLLTSRRPDTISNWLLNNNFRLADRNVTSLPQYFKQKGYYTEGLGKIFHRGLNWSNNDPVSWSVPWRPIDNEGYINERYGNWSWSAATEAERQQYPLPDEVVLEQAKQTLRRLAPKALSEEENFFLGVGFLKPHLPFVFPEEFLKLYPLEKMDVPSTDNKYFPRNYGERFFVSHTELVAYPDVLNTTNFGYNEVLPDSKTKVYRRAYFATVSFVDSLVGLLLDELERLGLGENTIVLFMGDHGWHLGENGIWGKYTNFEQATHTPLILKIPGLTDEGLITDSIVEFTDVFPTVVEAAGLGTVRKCPQNSGHVDVCTEGVSLMPLVFDPDETVKDVAVSQIYTSSGPRMAYSIRSDRFRYTEWIPMKKEEKDGKTDLHFLFDEVQDFELYDLYKDPEENINIAGLEKHKGLMRDYSGRLRQIVQPVLHDVRSILF